MEVYSGAEDIYRELVEKSEEGWLLGLVAFAIIEEQRIEWMRHHENQYGNVPNHEEIRNWYEQQPSAALIRARGTAENILQAYSEEVSVVLDNEYRKEVEEDIIVSEIKELKRFWPQFGVNLAGGFASALLFAALLMLIAFLVLNDTSPVELIRNATYPHEVTTDDQKNGSH